MQNAEMVAEMWSKLSAGPAEPAKNGVARAGAANGGRQDPGRSHVVAEMFSVYYRTNQAV